MDSTSITSTISSGKSAVLRMESLAAEVLQQAGSEGRKDGAAQMRQHRQQSSQRKEVGCNHVHVQHAADCRLRTERGLARSAASQCTEARAPQRTLQRLDHRPSPRPDAMREREGSIRELTNSARPRNFAAADHSADGRTAHLRWRRPQCNY